ncbi:MAG: phosphatase PAP2 family protein [Coprobacillus sp.]|nr:phosphatase PAP2 family protein [Coprobacillus sp.]
MKNILKQYKHAWVFLYFIIYVPWYFGIQYRSNIVFHDIYTFIDQSIPFIAWFVLPYVYWYLFVAGTIAYLFFTNKSDFYKCVAFLFIGMTICLIAFTIYPTSFNHRPLTLEGNSFCRFLVNFIYTADKSQNVCPSIHVFNSIGCAIALLKCEKLSHHNGIKLLAIISAILITLSTMFIKQHSIIDAVMAGILSIILYVLVYKVDYTKKFIKK